MTHRDKIVALLDTLLRWGKECSNEQDKNYNQGRSLAFFAAADEVEAILADWSEITDMDALPKECTQNK